MARNKKTNRMRIAFVLFCIAIPIANFLLFYVYTNFSAITMAFTDSQGTVSLYNFQRFGRELMRPESDLRIALQNTLITFAILFVTFPFKVLVSYFIYKKIPGAGFYRVVFFLPTIIFSVAVAMIFERLIGVNGFIAQGIAQSTGQEVVELLTDTRYANLTIWANMIWLGFPGDLIIWGGTFARIPEDVLESASLDGVTWWQEFTKIIVPMVWPTVALQMVLLICNLFMSTGQVWLLTKGQYGTHTVQSWMYKILYEGSGGAYTSNVYNYLSAVGLIITLVAVILSTVVRKWSDKVFEEVEF